MQPCTVLNVTLESYFCRRVAANDEVSNHRPRKLGLRLGPFTNRQRNRECQPGDIPGRDCNPFRNNRLRNNNGGNTNQGGNQDPLIELRTRECLPGEVPGVDCRGDFRGAFVPNRECRPGKFLLCLSLEAE